MNLEGKAAVVTGGGTGVGRATGLLFARLGCRVLVNYSRSQAEAEQTASEIEALGVRAIPYRADVADDDACRAMMAFAAQEFGRIDVLINNAATTSFIAHDNLDGVTDDDWRRIFAVNVQGPFQCARAAKEYMLAASEGEIVNVSSVAAYLGSGSSIPYAASKAALNNLTVALARALAPRIRVNGVAAGFITGRWLQKGLGRVYERQKRSFEESLPLRRVCEPDDVAQAIAGIVTGSDLITGQTLVCDGGMLVAKWNQNIGFGSQTSGVGE